MAQVKTREFQNIKREVSTAIKNNISIVDISDHFEQLRKEGYTERQIQVNVERVLDSLRNKFRQLDIEFRDRDEQVAIFSYEYYSWDEWVRDVDYTDGWE